MRIRAKALVIFFILSGIILPVSAETDVIPILAYSGLVLDGQTVHSLGGAAVVQKGESSLIVSYLNSHFCREAEKDVPSVFHTVDLLLDVKQSRQQYLLIAKSSSDKPFTGGLGTFQAGAAWGYEIVKGDSASLILGAGAAVGEFGIDSPLIPVPLLRLSGKWEYAQFSFDFLTGPNLSATLFPGSKIRMSLDSRMDKFRDMGDLLFDCALHYRFFDSASEYGDFAGLSAGIKRDELAYNLSTRDEEYSLQYYQAYGKIDFSVVTISSGFAFGGQERHGDSFTADLGDGFFFDIQCLYQI